MAILNFCADAYIAQPKGADILSGTVELAKMAIDEMTKGTKASDYSAKNELVKGALLAYACERGQITDDSIYNMKTEQGFRSALNTNPFFGETYFAVIKRAVELVNSKAELSQIYSFIDVLSIAEGDSVNFVVEGQNLFAFEKNSYSNTRTKFQYAFNDNLTMLPENREASVAMDLYQMTAHGWDFGKFIARIALSQRVAIQKEAVEAVLNTANVLSSAFVLGAFSKSTYVNLQEKLQAYNNAPVFAYGTKSAFTAISDGLDAKYLYGGAGNELLKTGMITDLFGVPSVILDNAISLDGQFNLTVPSNKILLASNNDKLVKCLIEGSVNIIADEGTNNSLKLKNYKVQTSWTTKVITNKAHGVITIS